MTGAFYDCPLCGADLYSNSRRPGIAKKRLNSHLRNAHSELIEEFRFRSIVTTLGASHPHETPKRKRPISPPTYCWADGIRTPIPTPTEEEKKSGDTPRLRAYLRSA